MSETSNLERKERKQTARDGEAFIHKRLPGSLWLNKEQEAGAGFDILWQGVKIDVKATKGVQQNYNSLITFSTYPSQEPTINVFVAFLNEQTYCWVRNTTKKLGVQLSLDDAIAPDQLPKEIMKTVQTMTKQMKDKRVSVVVDGEDYLQLRATLVAQGKSVSEFVRVIIKDFLNKQTLSKQQSHMNETKMQI